MKEDYIELIDKFLHNELSDQEQKEFDKLYETNDEFKDEIKIQQAISLAIQDVRNSEILNEIENQHTQFIQKQTQTKWWKWGLSAIIVSLLLIIGYFMWRKSTVDPISPMKEKTPHTIQKDAVDHKQHVIQKDRNQTQKPIIDSSNTKTKQPIIDNDSINNIHSTTALNDTLLLNEDIHPSYLSLKLIKEKDEHHYYEFDGKSLKIYGIPQLDVDLCRVSIRQNKLYLFQPGDKMFLCEIKKTTQKTKISFLKEERLVSLFLSSTPSQKTNSIKIEQKLVNEKEVKTKFSIFTIQLSNNDEGHLLIPSKKQLLWTKNIADQIGNDFNIIFFPENKSYYLYKNKKYFKLSIVKQLQPMIVETDPIILRYLTTHTENVQIHQYTVENDALQYGN